MPEPALNAFRERIRAAAAAGHTLRLRGGGTKDFFGRTDTADVLDTTPYAGMIDYDPAELVFTARCGTPLSEIEAALALRGQWLPFDPPHFGPAATLGGAIASGLAGPRRAGTGPLRDFVLGATLMDGQGRVMRFGGRVVKNVAGYDVARLLAGSLGALALILDASVRVLPVPTRDTTLCFDFDAARAIRQVNEWAGRPLPIAASAWLGGRLYLRLAGAAAAVATATGSLGGESLDAASSTTFWDSVREQTHPFFVACAATATLWRLALPPTAPLSPGGEGMLIEWHGGQRWLTSDAPAGVVRSLARDAGGHAVAFRRADETTEAFETLPAPVLDIHRRIKAAFDPAGVFDHRRLYSVS